MLEVRAYGPFWVVDVNDTIPSTSSVFNDVVHSPANERIHAKVQTKTNYVPHQHQVKRMEE